MTAHSCGWGLMWGTGSFLPQKRGSKFCGLIWQASLSLEAPQALEESGASFEMSFLYKNALMAHHFNHKLVLVFDA